MCFGAGGLSFAVLSRRLVLQLGEVGLVRGGGFVLLVTVSVIAFAPGVVPTALACLMMGLGFYMLHNTLQTNATQMAPERRGAAVSAFALSFFIGQSCGVAIAGWGIVYLGARIVIIASAVGMLLTAMNFMREKQRALAA
jgi:predicted MFS family arabinose efflux permease